MVAAKPIWHWREAISLYCWSIPAEITTAQKLRLLSADVSSSGVPPNVGQLTRRSVAAGLVAAALLPEPTPAAASVYRWEPVQIQPDPIRFADERGAKLDLYHYRGHPILLNLWASWCGPCIVELPALSRLQHDLSMSGLIVLALSVDRGGMADVLEAHKRLRLKRLIPLVDIAGASLRILNVAALPTSFAIDASGKFVARRRGAVEWDMPAQRGQLQALLQNGK